jgi:hypothetical protein
MFFIVIRRPQLVTDGTPMLKALKFLVVLKFLILVSGGIRSNSRARSCG